MPVCTCNKKMAYLMQYEIVNLLAQVVYAHNACPVYTFYFSHIPFQFKYFWTLYFVTCSKIDSSHYSLWLVSHEFFSNSIRYLICLTQSTMGYWVLKSLLVLSPFSIQMPLLMIRLNVCCKEFFFFVNFSMNCLCSSFKF